MFKLNYTKLLYILLAIALILGTLKYFKVYPFNEEYFRQTNETCYKTCINTSTPPYIVTTTLKEFVPSVPKTTVPSSPKVTIPSAPMLTGNGVVVPPSPSILIDKKLEATQPIPTSENVLQNKRSDLIDSIKQGIKLKKIEQKKQAEIASNTPSSSSSNPLLEQIRQGVQLKKVQKIVVAPSTNSSGLGSLQDEIAKKLALRRKAIEDDTDSFDEFFRFFGY